MIYLFIFSPNKLVYITLTFKNCESLRARPVHFMVYPAVGGVSHCQMATVVTTHFGPKSLKFSTALLTICKIMFYLWVEYNRVVVKPKKYL